MEKGRIDLHIHTTASDGTFTPREVVRYALEKGILAVAITDHDDVSGVEEALIEGELLGVEVFPGVEFSVDHEGTPFHLLGYMIDYRNKTLNETLDRLKKKRGERNLRIIEKLNELGFELTYDEILEEAGEGAVGRPHFARVMMKKGYVGNFYEAFNKYLRKDGPAYAERDRVKFTNAVNIIRSAGGLPVIAHPHGLEMKDRRDLGAFLDVLIGLGLAGIEVYYSKHTKNQTAMYLGLAEEKGLVVTGGTDFHGENKPGVDMGSGKGNMFIPYSLAVKLREACAKKSG